MLHHLSATLDNWDPGLIDKMAKQNHLIVDNSGVGASSGKVPPTIQEMAQNVVNFVDALNIDEFDLMGISMGGMVAQEVAMLVPEKILARMNMMPKLRCPHIFSNSRRLRRREKKMRLTFQIIRRLPLL